ncbi:DUF3923 family protein [Pediococcus parvulus]
MWYKRWWIVNAIWIILFISCTVFVMIRKVDGSGAVQTLQNRLLSLLVLGIFLVIVFICQLIIYMFLKHNNK